MENKHNWLRESDRYLIEDMLKNGYKKADIARKLGVSRCTITREIQRGSFYDETGEKMIYSAQKAQQRHDDLLSAKQTNKKIYQDKELLDYIENKILNEGYSPEQVLEEIKLQQLEFKVSVSIRTIYRYIEEGIFPDLKNTDLPMYRKKEKAEKREMIMRFLDSMTDDQLNELFTRSSRSCD